MALIEDAAAAGVGRFVMASTCSNYGRMADPTVPVTEDGVLAPVSLYAEQKVAVEKTLLALDPAPFAVTCLRFATVYGVAPRMRFDLTVNEFTRDLWADRRARGVRRAVLAPVRPRARRRRAAIATVLEAPAELVAGEVFNVGATGENYRKLDLVEVIRERSTAARSPTSAATRTRATTRSVRQDRRPARLRDTIDGADGHRRADRGARGRRASGTPSMAGTGTSPSTVPLFDLRLERRGHRGGHGGAASAG